MALVELGHLLGTGSHARRIHHSESVVSAVWASYGWLPPQKVPPSYSGKDETTLAMRLSVTGPIRNARPVRTDMWIFDMEQPGNTSIPKGLPHPGPITVTVLATEKTVKKAGVRLRDNTRLLVKGDASLSANQFVPDGNLVLIAHEITVLPDKTRVEAKIGPHRTGSDSALSQVDMILAVMTGENRNLPFQAFYHDFDLQLAPILPTGQSWQLAPVMTNALTYSGLLRIVQEPGNMGLYLAHRHHDHDWIPASMAEYDTQKAAAMQVIARQIAHRLDEPNLPVILAALVEKGEKTIRALADEALMLSANPDRSSNILWTHRLDGFARTPGGIFFTLLKRDRIMT